VNILVDVTDVVLVVVLVLTTVDKTEALVMTIPVVVKLAIGVVVPRG
jgi:hypothetical protein